MRLLLITIARAHLRIACWHERRADVMVASVRAGSYIRTHEAALVASLVGVLIWGVCGRLY